MRQDEPCIHTFSMRQCANIKTCKDTNKKTNTQQPVLSRGFSLGSQSLVFNPDYPRIPLVLYKYCLEACEAQVMMLSPSLSTSISFSEMELCTFPLHISFLSPSASTQQDVLPLYVIHWVLMVGLNVECYICRPLRESVSALVVFVIKPGTVVCIVVAALR